MFSVDSVSLRYGTRPILNGCYLQVEDGEVLGLLGRNGSGKSSLLKLIFGSISAQYLHLKVNGTHLKKPAFKSKDFAYLAQDGFLPWYISVSDVVADFDNEHQFLLQHPLIDKIKLHRIKELSGGEQRFLETLWILSRPVQHLLLDEPFAGISPIAIEFLQEMIRKVGQTKSIILTDHRYRELLAVTDRVVLLHNQDIYPIHSEEDLIFHQYIPA